MLNNGIRAFVYAKCCGIIGASFVGKRLTYLHNISKLNELDRLIFEQGSQQKPERMLLPDLEERIEQRTLKHILSIVKSFDPVPQFLVHVVRSYEYRDVKNVLFALNNGEQQCPQWTDIGAFRTVHFESYPDREAMFNGTVFKSLFNTNDLMTAQRHIDQQYYLELLESLQKLAQHDRSAIEYIVREEIALLNIVWALRLRRYYKMSADEVKNALIGIYELDRDAVESLKFDLDNINDWKTWKRRKFLNPEIQTEHWQVDPRYVQNTVSLYLYRLALRSFHRHPLSLGSAFCFITLKQYEETILTSIAEGLGLGMTSNEVLSLLE
ncbi:MAG: V-type ATPase subunit [Treponema sp.]|jgi:vacuolar-type H+-ATPase subunit C/Vma6|nr:V-type ATPase subunit [Treponema sp.]